MRAVLEEEKTCVVKERDVEDKRFTCVMKFGGSSVATGERMREVADLILAFPEESPVIVLSAMGKTTNNLLLVMLKALTFIICYCVQGFEFELLICCVSLGGREGCELCCF